jgi:ribbon-helix-helix protein
MSPRERYNFLIDAEQREGLRRIKERDGIPESEQIRRAIDEWLEKKGVMKAGRTRARPRKRP